MFTNIAPKVAVVTGARAVHRVARVWGRGRVHFPVPILGLQALLKVNLRLATTDYVSNGYDGL